MTGEAIMLSRRQFLVGLAGASAGLILPEWVLHAERYIEGEGAPLLETPARTFDTLHAIDWGDGAFQLFLGDPGQSAPKLSWGEFAERYFGMEYGEFVSEHLGLAPGEAIGQGYDEEDEVPEWEVVDQWVYQDSPSARAFEYLEGLQLETDLGGTHTLGSIDFIDGPCPGNSSRIVNAADELSLSLLQKRLNDLGECIRVVVDSGV
jgi:hypothetical protein